MTEAERMALWKTRLSKHRKTSGPRDAHSTRHACESDDEADDPDYDSPANDCSDVDDAAANDYQRAQISETKRKNSNAENFRFEEKAEVKQLNLFDDSYSNNDASLDASIDDAVECIDVTKVSEKDAGGIVGTSVQTCDPNYPLDPADILQINNLIALQEAVFQSNPYPQECFSDTTAAIANIFVCICKTMGTLFYRVEDFHLLGKDDQIILLRSGIAMSIYLHGAYGYDSKKQVFPRKGCREALKVPPSTSQTLRTFSSDSYTMLVDFYTQFGPELEDEGVLVMLSLVIIFQVNGVHDQLHERTLICDLREKYIQLLGRYLKFRQGMRGINETLPKLLNGLEIPRKIAEYHTKVDINPSVLASDIMVATKSTSYSYQMSAIRDVMKQALGGHHPQYASVLGSSDAASNGGNAVLNLPNSSPLLEFHHPFTNAIFGPQTRTDVLFTNALEHIAQCKEKLLCISYEPESFKKYCALETASAKTANARSSTEKCVEETTRNKPQTDAKSEKELLNGQVSWKSHPPNNGQHSDSLLASCSNRETLSTSTSINKKKGIQVLCEMLEYMSKCDDPDAIESLQSSLPPHVLRNLAKKLNIN